MLEAISETARVAKEEVLQKKESDVAEYLLPRRAEILNIIKDHGLVSFDQIRRRFIGIPERTLSYDLKKLQDSNLIRKRGNTKGVWYESISD
jgi:DNA-binding transcriptional ArsR family regulator